MTTEGVKPTMEPGSAMGGRKPAADAEFRQTDEAAAQRRAGKDRLEMELFMLLSAAALVWVGVGIGFRGNRGVDGRSGDRESPRVAADDR